MYINWKLVEGIGGDSGVRLAKYRVILNLSRELIFGWGGEGIASREKNW